MSEFTNNKQQFNEFKIIFAREENCSFEKFLENSIELSVTKKAMYSYLKGIETSKESNSILEELNTENLKNEDVCKLLALSDDDFKNFFNNHRYKILDAEKDEITARLLVLKATQCGVITEEEKKKLLEPFENN